MRLIFLKDVPYENSENSISELLGFEIFTLPPSPPPEVVNAFGGCRSCLCQKFDYSPDCLACLKNTAVCIMLHRITCQCMDFLFRNIVKKPEYQYLRPIIFPVQCTDMQILLKH